MKTSIAAIISCLLFSSCVVIKIYESPQVNGASDIKPKKVQRKMMRSGEQVDLGQKGVHEILFFGKEALQPKGFLLKEEPLAPKKNYSPDSLSIWIPKNPANQITVLQSSGKQPLIVIDGERYETKGVLESLKPEAIKTMNVLKGAAAIEKYGEKGKEGVIEITTK